MHVGFRKLDTNDNLHWMYDLVRRICCTGQLVGVVIMTRQESEAWLEEIKQASLEALWIEYEKGGKQSGK